MDCNATDQRVTFTGAGIDALFYLDQEGEELKGLARANATKAHFRLLNADLLTKLRECWRELRAQKIVNLEQTTLKNHFKTSSE